MKTRVPLRPCSIVSMLTESLRLREIPKSETLRSPRVFTIRFAGFRSR